MKMLGIEASNNRKLNFGVSASRPIKGKTSEAIIPENHNKLVVMFIIAC